jgi:hypothetical protein
LFAVVAFPAAVIVEEVEIAAVGTAAIHCWTTGGPAAYISAAVATVPTTVATVKERAVGVPPLPNSVISANVVPPHV